MLGNTFVLTPSLRAKNFFIFEYFIVPLTFAFLESRNLHGLTMREKKIRVSMSILTLLNWLRIADVTRLKKKERLGGSEKRRKRKRKRNIKVIIVRAGRPRWRRSGGTRPDASSPRVHSRSRTRFSYAATAAPPDNRDFYFRPFFLPLRPRLGLYLQKSLLFLFVDKEFVRSWNSFLFFSLAWPSWGSYFCKFSGFSQVNW